MKKTYKNKVSFYIFDQDLPKVRAWLLATDPEQQWKIKIVNLLFYDIRVPWSQLTIYSESVATMFKLLWADSIYEYKQLNKPNALTP